MNPIRAGRTTTDVLAQNMRELANKVKDQFKGTCSTCLDQYLVLRDGDKVVAYTYPIAWLRDMGIPPFREFDPEKCPACIERAHVRELEDKMRTSETKT